VAHVFVICVYDYRNILKEVSNLTQTIQYESPAAVGRKYRINELMKLIQTERLNKSESEIIALYQMQTGLRREIVKSYLKLIYASGLYEEPGYLTNKILTKDELVPIHKEWKHKHNVEATVRELLEERYHQPYIDNVLRATHPNLEADVRAEAEKIVATLEADEETSQESMAV
jgi:hypothetical protein